MISLCDSIGSHHSVKIAWMQHENAQTKSTQTSALNLSVHIYNYMLV